MILPDKELVVAVRDGLVHRLLKFMVDGSTYYEMITTIKCLIELKSLFYQL